MNAKPIRLLSGFLTVGFWTLMSRILGFVREIMLTALVGPGPVMDAFVAAFRLPNMFRRIFAEGAFNAAFVPMYAKRAESGEDASGFAQQALSGLALVTLILVALGMVFMPGLVWLTADGFEGGERFDLAVGYGRVVFPYIFFMSLAALFSGALNANGRFAAAAAAPVLLNIFAVGAMALGAVFGGQVILWLIWIIPLAGIAQLSLVWLAAERAGIRLRPSRPRWSPEMRQLVITGIPAALAGGVAQINLLVGQRVASSTEGAVSWLFAADRLYQLPLGVVGIGVGIVLLPELSRRLKANDNDGSRKAFSRASEFALALTIPAMMAFLVVPLPLVSVMFERGRFDSEDAAAVAQALAIYGLGLPAFVLQKLQQPLFFAREDTASPFRYAVVAMLINAALAFGLFGVIGWLAPAVAATASAWAMCAMLWWGALRFGDVARLDGVARRALPRVVLASMGMAAAVWALAAWPLAELLYTPYWRYLALLALVAIGGVVYGLLGQVLGGFSLGELRSRLRRS